MGMTFVYFSFFSAMKHEMWVEKILLSSFFCISFVIWMTTLEWLQQATSEAREETGGYQLLSCLNTFTVKIYRIPENLACSKKKIISHEFLNRKAFKLNWEVVEMKWKIKWIYKYKQIFFNYFLLILWNETFFLLIIFSDCFFFFFLNKMHFLGSLMDWKWFNGDLT